MGRGALAKKLIASFPERGGTAKILTTQKAETTRFINWLGEDSYKIMAGKPPSNGHFFGRGWVFPTGARLGSGRRGRTFPKGWCARGRRKDLGLVCLSR
jgi:hypothetical protein